MAYSVPALRSIDYQFMKETETKKAPATLKIAVLVVAIIVLSLAGKAFDLQAGLVDLLEWIKSRGGWAPAIFVVAYILACVFCIPGSLLSLGAGAIFGVVKGSVCVSVGSTLGATCAFLIGRYFARDAVARRIEANPKFDAVDRAVAEQGWKIVFLIRLSPMFPFNLLNYGFGLTSVALRHYFFASWIAMLPGTVMYVYFGSLATDLALVGQTAGAQSPWTWAVKAIGLIATVAVTVYVTKLAKRALDTRLT